MQQEKQNAQPCSRKSPFSPLYVGSKKENGGDPETTKNNSNDDQSLSWLLILSLPLLLVYISNQWSRSSIYYLVNFDAASADPFTAMNVDVGFGESQYGILASLAFTSLFALASLVAGSLSDKYDRKLLTVASCLGWSAATLGTSFSDSYTQVLIWRIIMGLACAFATPAAYTLIKDVAPPKRQALASSLYGSGVYFGGALASLSILLDQSIGWRQALTTIGAFGFGSAGLATLVLTGDPKTAQVEVVAAQKGTDRMSDVKAIPGKGTATSGDKSTQEQDNLSAIDAVFAVLSTSRVQWLFMASFFRFSAGLCIGVWAAPYFRMAFADDASSYAVVNAAIVGLCGVASGTIGGIAADYLSEEGKYFEEANVGRLAVPIIGNLLAIPTWWFTVHAQSFEGAMAWLAIEYIVAECWFAPTVVVLQSSVGAGTGGTAQGMFSLTGAIGTLAPSLLGVLYGQGSENQDELAVLLGTGVCAAYFLSAVCFALSAKSSPPTEKVDLDAKTK